MRWPWQKGETVSVETVEQRFARLTDELHQSKIDLDDISKRCRDFKAAHVDVISVWGCVANVRINAMKMENPEQTALEHKRSECEAKFHRLQFAHCMLKQQLGLGSYDQLVVTN